jgi:glucose/arabinose dehydrogenase
MVAKRSFFLFILIGLLATTYNVSAIDPAHAQLAGFEAQNVKFLELTSSLNQPVFITNAGDGSGRLFIVQKGGQIILYKDSALLSTPFLNIQSIVNSSGSEQGLLGLAFHPDYETNGRFYTIHTDQNRSIVLSVFTRSSANPDQADPNSRVTLSTIPKSYTNHNGGTLAFGPDGYLYWSTGDGGSAGDPGNNAQNLNSLLGKILRLDVSSPLSYTVPTSNPFYNSSDASIRKEIWAYGLRNPWRFSFDQLTGDIYIGDVGQSKREEIDFQAASSSGGENYGWRQMEGSICYNPSTGCNQSGKVLPVAEYDHTLGCSVTGGYVYRGIQYPQMSGYYFYGDFCSGLVYTLHNDSQNRWTTLLIADTAYSISSFGEDEQGELYMADYATGKIYQVAYIPAPAKATLLSPSGAITDTQPTFSWNEVLGTGQGDAATWYYLWVDGPSGNVIKQWYQASDICNGATCSITSAVALSGGTYNWWVQTWNLGGYGPWSDGMSFDLPVPRPPIAAILTSPSGNITNNQPTYTWDSVLDSAQGDAATWYQLYVDGPSGNVIDQWYEASVVCSGGSCSAMPDTTLGGGTHTFWVRTWNPAGYGPWSVGMAFSTIPLGAATLVSPSGDVGTNYSPSYTWDEVSGATYYYLYIEGPSGKVLDQWYQTSAICSAGTCTAVAPVTLGGGSHTWWVQTYNSAGFGPWSSGMSFNTSTTPPVAATLVSPTGSIGTDYNPTYLWNEVAGALWYHLWVNGPSGHVFDQWYKAADVCSGGGTCSVKPDQSVGGGAHTFWVQTWNPAGFGPWSSGMSFNTSTVAPLAATLISPTGSLGSNHTPMYSWNQVTDALWYHLWVNGPSGHVFDQWYKAADVCSGGGTCLVTPAVTLADGAHTFWVQTWNPAGFGPWSSGMSFTPGAAILTAPSGNLGTNTPSYQWQAVSGVTWYRLWVNGPDGSNVIQQWYEAAVVCSGGTCSVTPTTALADGAHTFWVQTWNPAGYGPWSSARSFTIP